MSYCDECAKANARIAELEPEYDRMCLAVLAAEKMLNAANARADAAEQEVTFANNRARQACEDYEGIQKALTAERAETARLRGTIGSWSDMLVHWQADRDRLGD